MVCKISPFKGCPAFIAVLHYMWDFVVAVSAFTAGASFWPGLLVALGTVVDKCMFTFNSF